MQKLALTIVQYVNKTKNKNTANKHRITMQNGTELLFIRAVPVK